MHFVSYTRGYEHFRTHVSARIFSARETERDNYLKTIMAEISNTLNYLQILSKRIHNLFYIMNELEK